MIKLIYCVRRLPELSREEFQRYWRETHGPLVRERAETLGIKRYVQVHTLESPAERGDARQPRQRAEIFDGVAELWWESAEAFAAGARRRRAGRRRGSCARTRSGSSISRGR